MAKIFTQAEYGTYDYFVREVASFLDLGTNIRALGDSDRGRIDSIIQSGYHQFLYPNNLMRVAERVEGDVKETRKEEIRKAPHTWSFLSPLGSRGYAGQSKHRRPARRLRHCCWRLHVGGFACACRARAVASLARVSRTPATGDPQYAAIRSRSPRGWEVVVYPTPATELTFEFRYGRFPATLSKDNPVPICGNEHIETLLQSILSVAEERTSGPGAATQKFQERLAASIHIDKQTALVTESNMWKGGKNDLKVPDWSPHGLWGQ